MSSFQINTLSASTSYSSFSVSQFNNGSYIVAWLRETDVKAQIIDQEGNKVNNEFLVNSYTEGRQDHPEVTGLANGGFVVVWDSNDQYSYNSDTDVYAQIYDFEGNKVNNELLVNSYTFYYQSRPSVSCVSNSSFVVTWDVRKDYTYDEYQISAQLLDFEGNKIGSEFVVSSDYDKTNKKYSPDVTNIGDDKFVVVWESEQESYADGYGVYGQLFTSEGEKIDSELHINTYMDGSQWSSKVAQVTDSVYAVTWDSTNTDDDYVDQDYSGRGVYSQLLDFSGNKVGGEFRINEVRYADQSRSSVARVDDKNLAVAFIDDSHGGSSLRIVNQDGEFLGYEHHFDHGGDGIEVSSFQDSVFAVTKTGSKLYGEFLNSTALIFKEDDLQVQKSVIPLFNDTYIALAKNLITKSIDDQSFLITYARSESSRYYPFGQIFNIDGDKIGDEIKLSSRNIDAYGNSFSSSVSLEVLTDKKAVFALQSSVYSYDILYSVFDMDFNPIHKDYIANIRTTAEQTQPIIVDRGSGKFSILWKSYGEFSSGSSLNDITSRDFGVEGRPLEYYSKFTTSNYQSSNEMNPSLAKLNNGKFVLAWDNGIHVYARLFSSSVSGIGSDFKVSNNELPDRSSKPIVTELDNNFMITWEHNGELGGYDIHGQLFSTSGVESGAEFIINTATEGDQLSHSVSKINNEKFAVVWSSNNEIYCSLFNHFGERIENEFVVNTYNENYRGLPYISAINNEDMFIITWEGYGLNNGASTYGVYAKIFNMTQIEDGTYDPNMEASVSATPTPSPTIETSDSPSISAAPDPSLSPSSTPSISPTPSPSNFMDRQITSGGSYIGINGRDSFVIDSQENVIITTELGDDKLIVRPQSNMNVTVTDFSQGEDTIDLTSFTSIHDINDFSITAGSAILNLPENQKVILEGLTPQDLTNDDFIFSPEEEGGKGSSSDTGLVLGIVIGSGVAIALAVTAFYKFYCSSKSTVGSSHIVDDQISHSNPMSVGDVGIGGAVAHNDPQDV